FPTRRSSDLAEEEAYIEVIGDLEANIDKTHRWPMYWRVLEKVAGNPWEHIPLIKLAKIRRGEGGTFQMETSSQSGDERTGKNSCGVDKIPSLAPESRRTWGKTR